ncbi:peptidylprolyl isomerase [Achromobacter xylosoxidans]
MQSYLESVSRAPDDYPTEADLASAYERAKPQLAQPALYRVSQIFLPAPLGDAEAVAAARKQAQELVKRAQAPKADFAALARANSQDASSREQGGDIGFCRWPS